MSERLTKEYLDGLEMIKSMATPAPDGYGIDAEGTDGGYVTAGNPCDPATKAICHCDTFADATLICDTLNAAPHFIAAARAASGLTEEQADLLASESRLHRSLGNPLTADAIDSLLAERREVLALGKCPIEQTEATVKASSLAQWVKTRFVHVENYNELAEQLADKERECERLKEDARADRRSREMSRGIAPAAEAESVASQINAGRRSNERLARKMTDAISKTEGVDRE